jgi:hypothetical protein
MERETDDDFAKQLKEAAKRMLLKSAKTTPDPSAIALQVRIQERVDKTLKNKNKIKQLAEKKAAKNKQPVKTNDTTNDQEKGDPSTTGPNNKKSKIAPARGRPRKQPAGKSTTKGKGAATPTVPPSERPVRNAARGVDYSEASGDFERYNV